MLLTFILRVYALYNTFIIGSLIGLFTCLLILIVFYKDIVKWIIDYSTKAMKGFLKR